MENNVNHNNKNYFTLELQIIFLKKENKTNKKTDIFKLLVLVTII